MTITATLKSYNYDEKSVVVSVDDTDSDIALRLCGSDRSVVAHLSPGQRIEFDLSKNREGDLFAIDVTPVRRVLDSRTRAHTFAYSVGAERPSIPDRCREWAINGTQSERPVSVEPRITLEELLSSPIVRQLMERDRVDADDVRRLIVSMANAICCN